ncbi:MAG: segregation/condensation protein A [Candidatus Micrarchaeales archaeon]
MDRFDIENLVKEATWKDILFALVNKNELNPWDIDIIDIVGKYLAVVKGMKLLDLRVPANIILAAAILLRLKSDMLQLDEISEEQAGVLDENARPYVPVDSLSMRLRLPPRRKVTLNELIDALEEAMKLKEYREAKMADEVRIIPLLLSRVDVEADIEVVYSIVKRNLGIDKKISFSSLCNIAKKDDVLLDIFIPLLFLASRDRVMLLQDKFFGEILIEPN